MRIRKTQQIEFSSVLFDTLFGLVLFFSIDSFLEIKDSIHFIFYLVSLVILIHWWLGYKAADDAYNEEVTDSGLDLIIGIVQLILLDYIVLMARSFDYIGATWFLITLLSVDLIWTLVWRYVGKWRTKDKTKIKSMEKELDNNMKLLLIILPTFLIFILTSSSLSPLFFVLIFTLFYLLYIVLSFVYKIIDIDIF